MVYNKKRISSFELLRILSQFFIVLYHICYIWQGPISQRPFFLAVSIPLHIGVIIFVLLSGYFTIKASSRGLIKLLGVFIVYSAFDILYRIFLSTSLVEAINYLMVLSRTNFWFIRTYILLYLVSPMLNMWLNNANRKQRWYMLMCLGFSSCYLAMSGGDNNMLDGKTLVNFMFLYCVGNQLKMERKYWQDFRTCYVIMIYALLNAIIFILEYLYGTQLGTMLYKFCFLYSSPVLLVNAIIFFILFARLDIKSNMVNSIASSSLAIYLIHGNTFVIDKIHVPFAHWIQQYTTQSVVLFGAYILYTLFVILVCIAIDKSFSPLWNIIQKGGDKVYRKYGV